MADRIQQFIIIIALLFLFSIADVFMGWGIASSFGTYYHDFQQKLLEKKIEDNNNIFDTVQNTLKWEEFEADTKKRVKEAKEWCAAHSVQHSHFDNFDRQDIVKIHQFKLDKKMLRFKLENEDQRYNRIWLIANQLKAIKPLIIEHIKNKIKTQYTKKEIQDFTCESHWLSSDECKSGWHESLIGEVDKEKVKMLTLIRRKVRGLQYINRFDMEDDCYLIFLAYIIQLREKNKCALPGFNLKTEESILFIQDDIVDKFDKTFSAVELENMRKNRGFGRESLLMELNKFNSRQIEVLQELNIVEKKEWKNPQDWREEQKNKLTLLFEAFTETKTKAEKSINLLKQLEAKNWKQINDHLYRYLQIKEINEETSQDSDTCKVEYIEDKLVSKEDNIYRLIKSYFENLLKQKEMYQKHPRMMYEFFIKNHEALQKEKKEKTKKWNSFNFFWSPEGELSEQEHWRLIL